MTMSMLELLRSRQLTAEQMKELAEKAGLSVADAAASLERKEKKLEYRKEYNARPGRKAKRKMYNVLRKIKEDKATNALIAVLSKKGGKK